MTGLLLDCLGLLAVILLSLCTAVFVAAEFSLTTLERSQVENHVRQVGDKRARQILRAHRTLSFQLSGAQLGISLTTLVTGYIAKPAITELIRPAFTAIGLPDNLADPIALVLALLVAQGISMVLGELVPKNLAIARPLSTARATAGAQTAFSGLFRWLINSLNRAANVVVRRLGVEPAEELRSARSPHELGSLVRFSAAQGTLDQGTATLLDRSLRFGDRRAEELMTPRVQVEALRADATVTDLVAAARRSGFSRFPVHGGDLDDVRGVVHVKQVFGVPTEQRATTPVSALTRPVPTVPETLEGDALLERLRGSGFQVAIVVDEYGGTAGLVTLEDLVEEIVGDVRDEHDRLEAAPVRPLGTSSWLVSGLLRHDEVQEATGFQMPDGEYDTIAGLVLSRLGRIPEVGDELALPGWRITVMRMDRHRIAELRVIADPQSDSATPAPADSTPTHEDRAGRLSAPVSTDEVRR